MTKPTVSPARYWVTALTSRAFALGLAATDAVISVKGLRALDVPPAEAWVSGMFILIVQASVAVALTSGQQVGESFQLRFLKDKGPLGALKRLLGYLLLSLIVMIYVVDVVTNMVAFTGGSLWPSNAAEGVRAALAFVFGVGLTFGDEILHLFADENTVGALDNELTYAEEANNKKIRMTYQKHFLKSAEERADELGAEHGANWRP
jgi:hypothetical protein